MGNKHVPIFSLSLKCFRSFPVKIRVAITLFYFAHECHS
uniref:Uncharacterized protein n=1 Tax=Anguilla anguilla TaxID=7936 RepID=A0A0E9V1G7_ANGAN